MHGGHDDVVLVVEDDLDTREGLCDLLEVEGYRAVAAGDGTEAMAALGALPQPPCVVLLDLMMPGMNGWAFMGWFASQPQYAQVPVILISAVADLQHQAQMLRVADCLTKPVPIDRFLAKVGEFCAGPAAGRA